MFLSTASIRPFVQNENPDNTTGFRKPGASKSAGLSLRTPFKDRSINSVSPTSKYNSKLQMQKMSDTSVIKKSAKSGTTTKFQQGEADNIYMDDYASYKEVEHGYADIFPYERLDIAKFLQNYVSGGASPKYIPDYEDDELEELPVSNLEMRCSPLPIPVNLHDVPLPVFNF